MNSRLGVTATTDMDVLHGVLGCRPLRRTVQVRKPIPRYAVRLPGGTPILFALAALRSVPQAGSQFHGLATAIEAPCSLTCRRAQVESLQGVFEM
jgi:hypothetical protein